MALPMPLKAKAAETPVEIVTDESALGEFVGLPFAFSSETMSTSIGVAGVIKGAGQKQASVLGIAAISVNKSFVTYLAANSYQLPFTKQWLFSAEYYRANFPEGVYYLDDQLPLYLAAGSNNSSHSARVETHGQEEDARMHFRYILPIANGKQGAVASLTNHSGVSSFWNPLSSGVSSINFQPFYEHRDIGKFNSLQRDDSASGIEIGFKWDNRDSFSKTLKGNLLGFDIVFGNETQQLASWMMWKFQYAHFYQLPKSSVLTNHVLAFNVEIEDTPTWNEQRGGKDRRPPEFVGASLGGFGSLRGYSGQRFHGRSSVLYTAEYRIVPTWQPLAGLLADYYQVPWWQWVAFVDVGRVADSFNLNELHDDMKWSYGAAVRFEVEGVVVRTELAKSREGSQFWVMVNQPF